MTEVCNYACFRKRFFSIGHTSTCVFMKQMIILFEKNWDKTNLLLKQLQNHYYNWNVVCGGPRHNRF